MTRDPRAERTQLLQGLLHKGALSGHEIIARSLKQQGITHVYAIGGSPVDETLGACARVGLRVIGVRHQQTAVMASAAQNYVAGDLRSAVIVSCGPGVTNCTTGLLVAQDNRWPVLVIGGRRALSMQGRGNFQDLDGQGLFAPLVKRAALVARSERLSEAIADACRLTVDGIPGAVYLDVPEEALSGRAFFADDAAPPVSSHDGALSAIRRRDPQTPAPIGEPHGLCSGANGSSRAAAALASARRPVLLVGDAVRWSSPWSLLERLAIDFGIPFVTSPMGRGFVPDTHPNCLNEIRGLTLADADLVLMVGARIDWTIRFGSEIPDTASVVCVGIDAAESAQRFGRGIAAPGDTASVLAALLDALDSERAAGRLAAIDRSWLAGLQQQSAARRAELAIRCAAGVQPMSPFQWLDELRAALPDSAFTVLDGNVVMTAAQRVMPVHRPVARLTPGQNGCMGVGIPFAIGAKLADPSRPVITICGDFAFGLTAIDLETAIRHKVAIIVIVANNSGEGGLVRQRANFPADHPERVFRFTPGIRYDLIMTALGGQGFRVERPGELTAAIHSALAHDGPTCIDVLTNEDVSAIPVV
jgi:thiamine pyrophosphate-dependent acetolactate synthase large subunit-like protein